MLKIPKKDNLALKWIGLIGIVSGTELNCPLPPWIDTTPATMLSPPFVPGVASFDGQPDWASRPSSTTHGAFSWLTCTLRSETCT